MKGRSLQILVVVANTQMKTLRAEVEKGFMSIEYRHGLADPKRQVWYTTWKSWHIVSCLERE